MLQDRAQAWHMTDAKELLAIEFAPTDLAAWRTVIDRALGAGAADTKLTTTTPEGVTVRPLYTVADAPPANAAGDFPGLPPFRRGKEPVGRWDARLDVRSEIANPEDGGARHDLERDLGHGARSLWLRLDASARLGRDVASGADAAPGVACVSSAQLGALLAPAMLDRIAVALDAGGNALPAAALLIAAARARGVAPAKLSGGFGADPLAALARDGALPASIEVARAQLIALARWTSEHAPGVRTVCVSTLPHHEAGAHAVQEVAFTLATGAAYLRWLVDAGVGIDVAARQVEFRVAIASDLFMEIAKLRALRWLWAELVQAAGGHSDAASAPVHAVTSARTRTRRDPWVNMIRETAQAFAAHAGGADAVTTRGYDAAWGASDHLARRLALNVQFLLDEEAHVTRVADPAGGSWYAESLTDSLARAAWESFRDIERTGGMEAALASGRVAADVARVADARAARRNERADVVIGVTEFALPTEQPLARSLPSTASLASDRRAWTERARGDASALAKLAGLDTANIVDAAVEAATTGASLAAITGALAGDAPAASLAPLPARPDAAGHDFPLTVRA